MKLNQNNVEENNTRNNFGGYIKKLGVWDAALALCTSLKLLHVTKQHFACYLKWRH